MKATFENSIKVLIQAYLNDTLIHSNCHACAVGNLIANACGYKLSPGVRRTRWDVGMSHWQQVFMTDAVSKSQHIHPQYYSGDAKKEIDSTGYSFIALAKIESAFESVVTIMDDEMDDGLMFNGLLAVFNVLAEIHGVDLKTKEASIQSLKEAFA